MKVKTNVKAGGGCFSGCGVLGISAVVVLDLNLGGGKKGHGC